MNDSELSENLTLTVIVVVGEEAGGGGGGLSAVAPGSSPWEIL